MTTPPASPRARCCWTIQARRWGWTEILEAAEVTSVSRMRRETSHAVEQDAVAFELRLEGDAGAAGEVEQGRFFVEGVVVLDGFEGEGAVHGSGFEVEEAEAAGEVGGEGALAGAGGAVDGDDGALALFGRGWRRLLGSSCGLRHPADSPFLRFELAGGGAFAEGLFVAFELVEGAGGLAGAAADWRCGGFAVRAFCRRSRRRICLRSLRWLSP